MKTDVLKKSGKAILRRFSTVQLIAIAVVIAFVFFIGDSNVFNMFGNQMKIGELNKQIQYYQSETTKNRAELQELSSNKENIEKFARENYLMRKPNEDVFIVH